jgi:hypothetical protein
MGALFIGGTALALRYCRHSGTAAAATRFLLGNAVFAVLASVLLAAFNVDGGLEGATASQYALFSAGGWVSLVALGWSAALAAPPGGRMRRLRLAQAGAAAMALLVVFSAPPALRTWNNRLGDLEASTAALQMRVFDPVAVGQVFPGRDAATLERGLDVLAERQISLYRGEDPSDLLGVPIAERYRVADGLCLGYFDAVLDAGTASGAGVAGWAWDTGAARRPALVLIAGPDGRIVGGATAAVDRPDVQAAVGAVRDARAGWFGYSRPTDGPARAYAILGSRIACPLPNEIAIRPPER